MESVSDEMKGTCRNCGRDNVELVARGCCGDCYQAAVKAYEEGRAIMPALEAASKNKNKGHGGVSQKRAKNEPRMSQAEPKNVPKPKDLRAAKSNAKRGGVCKECGRTMKYLCSGLCWKCYRESKVTLEEITITITEGDAMNMTTINYQEKSDISQKPKSPIQLFIPPEDHEFFQQIANWTKKERREPVQQLLFFAERGIQALAAEGDSYQGVRIP